MAERSPTKESKCRDESGHTFTPIVNPFTVNLIFRHFLKFVPLPCLKILRLVSKDWKKEVDKAILRRQLVCLSSPEEFELYQKMYEKVPAKGHVQFRICDTELLSPGKRRFWELFGPRVIRLELTNREIYWSDIVHVVRQLPKLRELCLTHTPINPVHPCYELPLPVAQAICIKLGSIPSREQDAVKSFSTMFKLFPRMEALSFHKIWNEGMHQHLTSLLLPTIISANNKLENLKHLEIPLVISTNNIAYCLKHVNLPLKTLSIEIEEIVNHEVLCTFFDRLSCTLEALTICFPYDKVFERYSDWYQDAIDTLGSLKNLRSLRCFRIYGNLYILRRLKHLEELSLKNSFIWDTSQEYEQKRTNSEENATQKLTKISIENDKVLGYPDLHGQVLSSLLLMYKNIKFLGLEHVNDCTLYQIYLQMPQLTRLHLSKAKCTDAGVTGISAERLATVPTVVPSREDVILRDYLSIGSLQNLTEILIKGAPLTDRSIILGLWDCKRLTTLCLRNAKITNTALKSLREEFGSQLTTVDVTVCATVRSSRNISHKNTSNPPPSVSGVSRLPEAQESEVREFLKFTEKKLTRHDDSLCQPKNFFTDIKFNVGPGVI